MRQAVKAWPVVALLLLAPCAFAQDDVSVVRTEDQLRFKLPPDWPIERRGGVAGPVPIEEYLAIKFKALEAQLQALDQRLNSLDLRLRVFEQTTTAQGLRSGEQPRSP